MPPTPDDGLGTAADLGRVSVYTISILTFVGVCGRWLAAKITREALEPIKLELSELTMRVDTMETTLKTLTAHTEAIPEIRAIAERAEASLERTELALTRLSQNFLTVAREVSELKAASQRTRAD